LLVRALDANTGATVTTFGDNGSVRVNQGTTDPNIGHMVGIAADATSVYFMGADYTADAGGPPLMRIERRDRLTGAL
jgi:glucose dehydrogenase